jgi:mRNA interferase RelE/StbE
MTWQVGWTPPARRDIRRLDPRVKQRIFRALDRLAADPTAADIRQLVGTDDLWRLRVGDYRVIFWFDLPAQTIQIARVAHRRDAYRS